MRAQSQWGHFSQPEDSGSYRCVNESGNDASLLFQILLYIFIGVISRPSRHRKASYKLRPDNG